MAARKSEKSEGAATLKVEYLDIAALIPYSGNAKEHPEYQVEQIADSIREFGFLDPVGIDENGTIIEGHGRVLAAQKLGMDTVPVVRLEGLTEEQKRAYTLVHNKLTMNTGFNIEQLEIELGQITGIEMERFEFDLSENPFTFSMDGMNELEGYNEDKSEAAYFESAFTFPSEYKKQIVSYLKKHKSEITDSIIKEATATD